MNTNKLVTTEQSNLATENLDLMSPEEIVSAINTEDHNVAPAVELCLPAISQGADIIAEKLKKGGRLFIFGAGTSGRLGVLNATEITEKYNLKKGQINGIIAGGDRALRFSVENSEDNREKATADLMAFNPKPNENDVVLGISAGGGAAYILQVLEDARKLGIHTIGYSSNKNAKLKPLSDTFINPVVGPEVLTGSSRMKSGSAQEMTLITLLESAMAKIANPKNKTQEIFKEIIGDLKTAAPTVKKSIPEITKAVNLIAEHFNNGGRLFYFGQGTLGRLGVLDASECWPTFGVEHGTVNGRLEGGDSALRQSFNHTKAHSIAAVKIDFKKTETVRDAKGNPELSIKPPASKDIIVILGDHPYALAALEEAKGKGIKTIVFATHKNPILESQADVLINPIVHDIATPVATKFVLNTLTTASMVLTGKVLGNKMVDVAVMNEKLLDRAIRIIVDFTGKSYEEAQTLLSKAQKIAKDPKRHVVPVAIVMGKTGCTAKEASALLKASKGLVREALKKHTAQKTTKRNLMRALPIK